jgi:hypothetical protein
MSSLSRHASVSAGFGCSIGLHVKTCSLRHASSFDDPFGVMQAFVLFEESIPDSAAERVALASITGALHKCRVFPPEPRATLVHKATGYSAKLLRKADQCRAVLACSHLYWQVMSNHLAFCSSVSQCWSSSLSDPSCKECCPFSMLSFSPLLYAGASSGNCRMWMLLTPVAASLQTCKAVPGWLNARKLWCMQSRFKTWER